MMKILLKKLRHFVVFFAPKHESINHCSWILSGCVNVLNVFFCCHPGGSWGYILSFGEVICQVINVECSMVFNLLCFLGLFSCRHLALQFTFPPADTCTFVFCIWGFAFVAFLLRLLRLIAFLINFI